MDKWGYKQLCTQLDEITARLDGLKTKRKEEERLEEGKRKLKEKKLSEKIFISTQTNMISDLLDQFDVDNGAVGELDYNAEAIRLFPQLGLYKQQNVLKSKNNMAWCEAHPIYCGGRNGNAKVFVGNIMTANNIDYLDELNISHIVDCQGSKSRSFAEEEEECCNRGRKRNKKIFRFQIEKHYSYCYDSGKGKIMENQRKNAGEMKVNELLRTRVKCQHVPIKDSTEGVLKFFQPTFQWIDRALENGHNVLIHCLAGAHRAGTTAIAYLMHRAKLDVRSAIISAKLCRPIISPIGSFPNLLIRLDMALKEKRANEKKGVKK